MTEATIPVITGKTLKLTIRDPAQRRPQAQGRVSFSFDGTTVRAVRYRSAELVGEGEVASVVSTGGCGCGGRLALRITLTNGQEWFV